jgi:hypothetical protein
MKMTIYLPDDLAARMRDKLGDTNISAVCQRALRDELSRAEARAEITSEGFERVELYDGGLYRHVAFQGRRIAISHIEQQAAWLTARGKIAVYDNRESSLTVFDDWAALLAAHWPAEDLMVEAAHALGEKYVEELDI